ncbi:MAG TPA: energy transducer TonB [Vicinamibacterales bacterium]|jgi:TonB family protein
MRSGLISSCLVALLATLVVTPASAQGQLSLAGSFLAADKPGPIERRAKPVTPDNPIPRRTIYVAPIYPDAAALVDARVVVPLRVTVDESGYVVEVRRLEVPLLGAWRHPLLNGDSMSSVFDALVAASTDAVRKWRYDAPEDGPVSFDVSISFSPDDEPRATQPPPVPESAPPAALEKVLPAIAPHERIEPPPAAWAEGVRPLSAVVGSTLVSPKKTKHVPPVYPQDAKVSQVQGAVLVEARVEPDGRISHARVIRSIPQLDQAAIDAVMQWEFEPVNIQGEPVPYIMTATVMFSLN